MEARKLEALSGEALIEKHANISEEIEKLQTLSLKGHLSFRHIDLLRRLTHNAHQLEARIPTAIDPKD